MTSGQSLHPPILRRISTPLAILWTGVIAVVCLFPAGTQSPDGILLCLICSDDGVADFFLNIVLYLPLGFFIRIRTGSTWTAVAAGFLLSFSMETAQLWIPGRFTTLADLVANTLGAGLGGLLAIRPERWLFPTKAPARRMATFWAAVSVLLVAAPALLVTPSVPDGPLYANWTPESTSIPVYEGHMYSAEIDGIPLPSRRLDDPDAVRNRLASGGPLTVRFESSPDSPGPAQVFRILNDRATPGLTVTARGEDLIVWLRYRADDLYLDRPAVRLREVMLPANAGDTLTLVLDRDAAGVPHVMLNGGSPVSFGIPPGRGWGFLYSLGTPPTRLASLVDLLWIALIFFPLGWWSGTLRGAMGAAVLPLLTLAVVPAATVLLPTPPLHYIAALAGVLGASILRTTLLRSALARTTQRRALVATKW